MKRSFSNREKILLVILALMLVGCLYYLVVYQPVTNAIDEAVQRQADADSESTILAAKLGKMNKMLRELEAIDEHEKVSVPDYDNVKNVLVLLNGALADTTDFSMTFHDVVYSKKIVSRTVDLSFTAQDYAHVDRVVKMLYEGPYRCEITSVEIRRNSGSAPITGGEVNARVCITFFEFDING